MQSARLPIPCVVRAPRPASSCAVAAAGPSSRLGQLQQGSARNAWNSGCVSARRRRRRKGGAWQAQARVVQSAELSLPSVSGLRRAGAARIRPRFKLGFDDRVAVGGQGRGAVPVTAGPALTVREEVGAASWESLAETLAGAEDKPRLGPGERLVHARERVFRAGEEPKLVLYRDSFSWCAYCQRVWLQLEEKRISYRVEKIDMSCYGEKPPWYKSMVPSGLLPAVKLLDGDEEPLTDSLGIMLHLEEKFPDHNPLLPSRDAPEFAAAEEMMRLEKPLVEAWVARMIRTDYQEGAFESVMDAVDSALRRFDGPYFLGSHFSLVDAVFAPFLERIAASLPYWLGIRVRGTDRWAALNPWFDAMDTRPSYVAMKGDDYSIAHNLEVQMGSCNSSEDGAFFRALVDGTHGSWDLPLKPEVTAWGSDDGTGRGGAKVEAAQSLIENHERIVDYAVSDMRNGGDYRSAVDAGFRHVAEALLKGVENVEAPKNMPQEVGAAAVFLRDRVGVPKDMTYPAARQLRAHLQWLAGHSGLALAIPQSTLVEPDSSLYSWLYPSKDDLPDDKEMTIWDHLEELRDRVAVSAGAIGAAILGCFFFSKDLIKILEAPVYSQGVRFLQLSPGEFFFTTLKVSGYSGLMIGSPVLLYEIIAFVLPGLTRSERKFLGPIVLGSSVLFYAGVAFSYIVLTPAALNFFVNYAEGAVESLWSIDQYFEFVLVLLFSTGLAFQVPVIQLLLGQTRIVTGNQMLSVWKYVVVGSVAAAAVLTPSTDPLTQMLLAGPLMGLYLGGALAVKALVPEPEPDT